jgi:hypothetical protein
MSWIGIMIMLGAVVLMEVVHVVQERNIIWTDLSVRPLWVRWPGYVSLVMIILLFGVFERPFIYFQF